MDRPRTPPLRTEPVTTRLTPADVALVEAAAAAMGVTRSTAMRELLLEAARHRLLQPAQTENGR